jgi:hypothetical protein
MPDPRRRSSLSVRAVLFLALLLPVWAFGVRGGQRLTGSIRVMPPFFGDDIARFERLRPRLAPSDRVFLLMDRSGGLPAGQRFFVAQYTLAPVVLVKSVAAEAIAGQDWPGDVRLVICAFDDRASGARALAELEQRARARGLAFAAEPIDEVVTLVRLGDG